MTAHADSNQNYDTTEVVMKQAREALDPSVLAYIDECLQKERSESLLIAVLHRVQEHYGYLPKDKLNAVSQLMQIPTAKVTGVASFYHLFHLEPRGKYIISLCLGTACYVKGASAVAAKIKEEIGIEDGETTADGLFTLECARCLGACALAPVMKINDQVYAQVTPEKIPNILKKYFDAE